LDGIRRATQSIQWGATLKDKILIATYYGLLVASRGLPVSRNATGMHPELWLGNIVADTPTGSFACRRGTTDFEIINPNYEPAVIRFLAARFESVADERTVFVDVGAHVGKYTVLAGRTLRTSGTVVAIEPDPDNFAALTRNMGLNGLTNAVGLNVGCWSSDGLRVLHRQTGDLGGHSFVDTTRGGGGFACPSELSTDSSLNKASTGSISSSWTSSARKRKCCAGRGRPSSQIGTCPFSSRKRPIRRVQRASGFSVSLGLISDALTSLISSRTDQSDCRPVLFRRSGAQCRLLRTHFEGFAMFIAVLDVGLIAFFVWSMMPPKETR